MDWIETVKAIAAGTGCTFLTGVALIFLYYIAKKVGDLLTHSLTKQIESEYNKELENFKASKDKEIKELESKLERANNIVNLYDSTLFKAYNDIWKAMICARTDLECAILYSSEDITVRYEKELENFKECRKSFNNFFDIYHLNSLFISSNIRELFLDMIAELKNDAELFREYRLDTNLKDKTSSEILDFMISKKWKSNVVDIYIEALREKSEKVQEEILKELNIKSKIDI